MHDAEDLSVPTLARSLRQLLSLEPRLSLPPGHDAALAAIRRLRGARKETPTVLRRMARPF